jgi:hypothetical protein
VKTQSEQASRSAVIPSRGLADFSFLRGASVSTEPHLDWSRCAQRLSKDDCQEIVEACREFPITPPSTVGEDRYPDHREADTRKVGMNARTKWIFQFVSQVAAESARTASGLDLTEINRAPQYVEYRPGWGHFDWHNDYSHGLPSAPRKLTVIVQLSQPEDYDGGTLQCFGASSVEDLPRELGTVIAFPSFLYHRVTPVTRGLRRALVAWIGGPRIR